MMPATKQAWSTVGTVLITSMIGGSFGTYVSFKLLEQRVASGEARQAEDRTAVTELTVRVEANRKALEDQNFRLAERLAEVGRDVSYIRGRIETNVK